MGARADSALALTIIAISVQILIKAYKSNNRSICISILVKKKNNNFKIRWYRKNNGQKSQ